MKRKNVIKAINSERDYQDKAMMENNGSHIVPDFPLGSALSAIQYKLDLARASWYSNVSPYEDSIVELRKIAAICVQMGEEYGMLRRD